MLFCGVLLGGRCLYVLRVLLLLCFMYMLVCFASALICMYACVCLYVCLCMLGVCGRGVFAGARPSLAYKYIYIYHVAFTRSERQHDRETLWTHMDATQVEVDDKRSSCFVDVRDEGKLVTSHPKIIWNQQSTIILVAATAKFPENPRKKQRTSIKYLKHIFLQLRKYWEIFCTGKYSSRWWF